MTTEGRTRRLRGWWDRVPRGTLGKDVPAGLVLGVESVPDGLASGML
ncbi:MAG: hypothetical protein L0H41_07175 [Microlunatus sp.]|nr:hypothetical protein [Microlunatus sp.]